MSEEEEKDVFFWGAVWVTLREAELLEQDAALYGNCYVKLAQDDRYNEPVGERVPPLQVLP